jgi:hypothetical protein
MMTITIIVCGSSIVGTTMRMDTDGLPHTRMMMIRSGDRSSS